MMRIGELSTRSGVSIPTIKYYIREGLLPPGAHTATNQADYDGHHLDRLELIRALREVADLPIATIRATLEAMDRPKRTGDDIDHLGVAFRALSDPLEVPEGEQDDYGAAAQRVDEVLERLGWNIAGEAGARADLIRAVVAIDRHFPGGASADALTRYGRGAERIAAMEIPDSWDPVGSPADTLRHAVLGTVLFEPVILALRRLAHIDRHRRISRAGTG